MPAIFVLFLKSVVNPTQRKNTGLGIKVENCRRNPFLEPDTKEQESLILN